MSKQVLTLLFIFVTSYFTVHAQSQNALAFDGIDDFVSVPNGSSFVAGATAMSITCWVFPTNSAPSYPNFDGFAGFRNDIDADFYLVQVSAAGLEGRFRNSTGTAFSITSNILTLNTWQHIALTYGNGWLNMYKNGIKVDSVAASGAISTTTVPFNIGEVVFSNADFLLTGKMDETSLWSRELIPSDLICLPSSGIDTASVGLELYYKFNQGTASGTNTTITTLIDEKGNANGVLNNIARTGTISNFVAGYSGVVNSVFGFSCPDVPYNFNGQLLTTAGVYNDTLVSAAGCDSLVQLQLQILYVDTAVNLIGNTLTANHVGLGYQWLDCDNGYAAIPGATLRNFTPTVVGNYAVIVSQSSCTDTSGCHAVATVGMAAIDVAKDVQIQPSITSSTITLLFSKSAVSVNVSVIDFTGKTIIDNLSTEGLELQIDLSSYASGIYFIKVGDSKNAAMYKVVKQ